MWRRLDVPGHEAAHLIESEADWRIEGASAFLHQSMPCFFHYVIRCDRDWSTRSTHVAGWIGETPVEKRIEVDREGRWTLDGEIQPQLAGCVDIDLNFSPVTNLLPIRRLAPTVGESRAVRAAWLRFPGFRLEVLEQVYRRIDDVRYRYESGGGAFTATLEVDPAGFVTEYPGFFRAERRG